MRERVTQFFVLVAIAEAISWAGLLAAMVVKYGPPDNELGVRIFGPLHGALFVGYGALTLAVAWLHRWRWPVTVVALACAVPPFATLVFERWARRHGRLGVTAGSAAPHPSGDSPRSGAPRRSGSATLR